MRFYSRAGNTALVLTALLAITACGNKGEVDKPATAQTTTAVPGTGAGQSETGGTGGSAATPGSAGTASETGAVAGSTSSGEGRAASEGSAPTSSQ